MRVERLTGAIGPAIEKGLADVLLDCVAGGASVGFLASLGRDEAERWWRATLREPHSETWIARQDNDRVVGVVRLILATAPNSPHRATVAKLLVHRDARGQGCASGLMSALEKGARALGRSLLVLDTHTGSPAEAMYERWGWRRIGVINDFAATPDGRLAPTTYLTKRL
jgi:GNAT superfamily N-acetyltransferase